MYIGSLESKRVIVKGEGIVRKAEKNVAGAIRIVIVGLAVLAQIFLLAFIVISLRHNAVYVYFLLEVLGAIAVISLIGKNRDASYTIAWLVVILVLPVFGYLLYVLWGRSATKGRKSKKIRKAILRGAGFLTQDPQVYSELEERHPSRKRITGFLSHEGFPLFNNTKCNYFPLGELQYEAMIADLEQAERFIFMEYFILGEGQLWDRIHDVLRRKAEQGVEVRLMYDDFGSILTAPNNLLKTLESEHIRAIAFNPVHRYISRLYINYRNHQKITVIDGNIGFTGGTNLADEYANIYEKHGHWKDAAIRLEGDAVWSLTVIFLQMWEAENGTKEDYLNYRPTLKIDGDGFYQPFSDGPVNQHNPAEAMYNQLISNAKEYVYITTPYLVIDDSMTEQLCMAAMGGTDVRIVTPKIWDHWYVHMVTRSNYGKLLEAGVRIYEYTPGYIHAKIIISDDDQAVTGSINMDYRSFNLHFENGVWICGAPVLEKIKNDILDTIKVCEEITLVEWKRRPWYIKFIQAFLRLFMPLF